MAKKCIPGVICIENMTLFVLAITIGLVCYLIYNNQNKPITQKPNILVVPTPQPSLVGIPTRSNDSFNDPYAPPLKTNGYLQPEQSTHDVRGGIPINIETRATGMAYQQIGILTPLNSTDNTMILPLMGRKLMTGRDKWQYYTMANGAGTIHAKLPVSKNGKSCTGEYGCDDIQNGDTVYVEGYKTTFTATIYENINFSYIPYI